MANCQPNEVVYVLLTLGECYMNYTCAARVYAQRYPNCQHPVPWQINIKRRSQRNALVRERQQNRALNNNDSRVLAVLVMVHLNPHINSRKMQRQLGIPRTTFIGSSDLFSTVPTMFTLCRNWAEMITAIGLSFVGGHLINLIGMKISSFGSSSPMKQWTFHSTGCLNRHNFHFWSSQNSHWIREIRNQHRWSLHTWVGIIDGRIIGALFRWNN